MQVVKENQCSHPVEAAKPQLRIVLIAITLVKVIIAGQSENYSLSLASIKARTGRLCGISLNLVDENVNHVISTLGVVK